MLMGSRRVVLFLPPYKGRLLGPPLGLLSLAGSVREAGYGVLIIDGALHPDYMSRVERALDDCLSFGVSLLTGPMIRETVQIARAAFAKADGCEVVLVGHHKANAIMLY